MFVDWFNRVWKRPPNKLDAELSKPQPDQKLVAELAAEIVASRDVFEALLTGRDYLFGEFGAADVHRIPVPALRALPGGERPVPLPPDLRASTSRSATATRT